MPTARNQEVFQKGSFAQAKIERTWSNVKSLLLLARCIAGNGVPSVARSNLP